MLLPNGSLHVLPHESLRPAERAGVMLLPDGSLYEGAFANDRFEGHGTYEYGGGRGCHVGGWRAGVKHGQARTHHLPIWGNGTCLLV